MLTLSSMQLALEQGTAVDVYADFYVGSCGAATAFVAVCVERIEPTLTGDLLIAQAKHNLTRELHVWTPTLTGRYVVSETGLYEFSAIGRFGTRRVSHGIVAKTTRFEVRPREPGAGGRLVQTQVDLSNRKMSPRPPHEMVDALQDVLHVPTGVTRPARVVKVRST